MNMNSQGNETETAARQSATMDAGVGHLVMVNGGAAVALLAFLQAVWEKDPDLSALVLLPIFVFACGAGAAGFINLLRYKCSRLSSKCKYLSGLVKKLDEEADRLSADAKEKEAEQKRQQAKKRKQQSSVTAKEQKRWSMWSTRVQWLAVALFVLGATTVTLGIAVLLCKTLLQLAVLAELIVVFLGIVVVCVLLVYCIRQR